MIIQLALAEAEIKRLHATIADLEGTISIFNYEIDRLKKIVKEHENTISQLRFINEQIA